MGLSLGLASGKAQNSETETAAVRIDRRPPEKGLPSFLDRYPAPFSIRQQGHYEPKEAKAKAHRLEIQSLCHNLVWSLRGQTHQREATSGVFLLLVLQGASSTALALEIAIDR